MRFATENQITAIRQLLKNTPHIAEDLLFDQYSERLLTLNRDRRGKIWQPKSLEELYYDEAKRWIELLQGGNRDAV